MNLPNKPLDENFYDEVYFESGVKNKVSAYEHYRWMPERSMREACSLIANIKFDTVLDYGCAKGFLVQALRLLGKEAYGVDISRYAIENGHVEAREFLSLLSQRPLSNFNGFDLLTAKDVFEHLTEAQLDATLKEIRQHFKQIFIAVPLGDGERYRIREYEMDVTHILRMPEDWWLKKIAQHGFKITFFDYKFGYIKEHWYDVNSVGNCFILAE